MRKELQVLIHELYPGNIDFIFLPGYNTLRRSLKEG